jgi:hypothetical protein
MHNEKRSCWWVYGHGCIKPKKLWFYKMYVLKMEGDGYISLYTSSRFSWMNRSMNCFLSYGTQRHVHFVLSKYLYFFY